MKKALVAAILGLAAVVSVKGQGQVFLYSYGGGDPGRILYGTGAVGTQGTGLENGVGATTWTVGVYYLAGAQASTVNAAMAGDTHTSNDPSYGTTWSGVTTSMLAGYPGQFGNSGAPQLVTVPGAAGTTATFVVVAYNGATYASSTIRGHSAAFEMTAAVSPASPSDIGVAMPSFSVNAVAPIPEPSTFALAGLGLAGLLIFRRRK